MPAILSHLRRAKQKVDCLLPGHHQSTLVVLSMLLLILLVLEGRDQARQDELVHDRKNRTSPPAVSLRPDHNPDLDPDQSPDSLPREVIPLAPKPLAVEHLLLELGPPAPDERLYLTVNPGDNLSLIFQRAGLGARDVHLLANSVEDAEVLANLYPGQQLAFNVDPEAKVLHSLELIKSPRESYVFHRHDSAQFSSTHILRKPQVEFAYRSAVIDDSLFMAAQRSGIGAAMTLELADIFGGVVDFMLETRAGDSFSVLFEEEYLDGKLIGSGRILAASFTNQGTVHRAVSYTDGEGKSNFYNEEGESMRKAFLQNPVDFTRISSNFNLSRRHPILNTIRAHRGTDYAAPTGTPVVATSDGKVTFAARNGSFGNLVVIQHGDRFETKYAHLNAFAKGVGVGSRVKQGQVVGYVGSTGSATGPHLHYEFLMDGVHRNWRTIHDELPKAESIASIHMDDFRSQTTVQLSMRNTRGASLQAPTERNAP